MANEIKTNTVHMTPEMARELLASNSFHDENEDRSAAVSSKAALYADMMADKAWAMNGKPLKV